MTETVKIFICDINNDYTQYLDKSLEVNGWIKTCRDQNI